MSDVPTEYNELVELIENNDPSVAAGVIQENFTSNEELEELVEEWSSTANRHHEDCTEFAIGVSNCADDVGEKIGLYND